MLRFCLLLVLLLTATTNVHAQDTAYDVVLLNGRVMDPETGLDAVRNVGIREGRIAEISESPLEGRTVVDATGLIVAPGFIDLHAHGQTNDAHRYQARDGVTTALELESGVPDVRAWIEQKRGSTLINYGASVSHPVARQAAIRALREQPERFRAAYKGLTPEETDYMLERVTQELEAGGLGIGMPVGYYPGATRGELLRLFELSAETTMLISTHVRALNLGAVQEVIANAAVTGAPLHVVHLNSVSLGDIDTGLALVAAAQQRGLDITTEVYPYTAASTSLQSTLFDAGWQERMGITYGDLQWEATGERLTEETFRRYRQEGGIVIIHLMKPEWIERGLAHPVTMIASDGMPYAPGAHPRTAGTFARVLGRYVREQQTLPLMDALAKMTLRPAQRLESIAPMMRFKGRVQVGADADLTLFDPDAVIDTATFEEDLSYSEGIPYVLVGGTFVVRENRIVPDVFPGEPVLGKMRR